MGPSTVGWCFRANFYVIDGERQVVPASADDGVGLTIDGVFVWMDEAGLHGAR